MFSLFISFDPLFSVFSLFFIGWGVLIILTSFGGSFFCIKFSFFKFSGFLSGLKVSSKLMIYTYTVFLFSVFSTLLFFNFLGLLPYFFTLTSQLFVGFFLSLVFWLAIVGGSIKYSFFSFFSHLVPHSSPLALSSFMVLIESISQLMRPFTLAIRLVANMTAGHLILSLCMGPIFFVGLVDSVSLFVFLLEMAVALIQAYVFVTLVGLYTGEFN